MLDYEIVRLLRSYLFWAMGKTETEYILKSFDKKLDRDNWVNEKEQRETIPSNDPLICKARREEKIDEPCEISIDD